MRGCAGLAVALWAGAAAAGDALTFVRSITLQTALPSFGGLSAIETADGASFVVMSDRGQAFDLTLDRANGTTAITRRDQPAPNRDSEGLALSGRDLFYSYEGPARVFDGAGQMLPVLPAFNHLTDNGSFEALAATPGGTVYTIPERSGDKMLPFPVFRFRDGAWDVARTLPRTAHFLPAGADIGPDGMLYVLERAFTPLGFRTRIRRFDPEVADGPVETLLRTPPGLHDNLEGLAVWTTNAGQTCLTMVSDNNFLRVQRTEIVEYSLSPPLAAHPGCD
ncbi:esterase-like activity of phytase family protein [uncultured Tateyamaria sp.]|uniref:esterase-like activity of phytase family protein n=1 Tax=Tateyamaria sp. 1078 TaxID=3417464 RepID=UPI002616ABBC|nr:esterase-like activity of phytase family protein [uncultured Tateyamaria sp.]